MKLALVGKEDVETLEKWVRERFESVPVRSEGLPDVGPEGVRIAFEESPFGVAQMGVSVFPKGYPKLTFADCDIYQACAGSTRIGNNIPVPRCRPFVRQQGEHRPPHMRSC